MISVDNGWELGLVFTMFCNDETSTFFSQKLKMLENEYKCILKMNREPPFNKSGIDTVYWKVYLWSVVQYFYWTYALLFEDLCLHTHVNKKPIIMFIILFFLQGCTAVVTGMAGCAGTTLRQEPTLSKTALIIFPTSTQQVSSVTQEFCSKGLLTSC